MKVLVAYLYSPFALNNIQSEVVNLPFKAVSPNAVTYLERQLCSEHVYNYVKIINIVPLKRDATSQLIDKIQALDEWKFAKFIVQLSGKFGDVEMSNTAEKLLTIINSSESYDIALSRIAAYIKED